MARRIGDKEIDKIKENQGTPLMMKIMKPNPH